MQNKKDMFSRWKQVFKNRFRLAVFTLFILAIGFAGWRLLGKKQAQPQYQTAQAEKGTLITSISGSGTITSGNYTDITTKVSGVVSKVYVTNGDTVVKGQKIAEVSLDDYAKERQTAAWVAYLEATEAVKDAEEAKVTADIQMWKDRETLLDAIDDVNNNKGDTEGEKQVYIKTVDETRLAFSASELRYLDADSKTANARAKVSAALRDYQENSATIVAPASGAITDLALAEGITVSANSTTSTTSGATIVSARTIGKVSDPKGQLIASVGLTEVDIVNVKANQKVTLTLDAYPDKTFTGKVLAIDTGGKVSSGVTNYPATILLDTTLLSIYPNMAVNAQIITTVIDNVILVPNAAIQTTNGQSTIRVMKNGQISEATVEVAGANDTQTAISSGLNEGDVVITGTTSSQTSRQGGVSPFGGMGGMFRMGR